MARDTPRPLGVFVGLATLDIVHRVTAPPARNEKITATRQDVAAGGPAANAAVVFAALGGRARLVTALGVSPVADLIRADLVRAGVEVVDLIPDDPAAPAISAVTVVQGSGDRSVVSMDATARTVPAPADPVALVVPADVVLVDGHHPDLAVAAATAAAAAGIPVVLDAGRWKPVFARLVPVADDVVCSADFRWEGRGTVDDSAAALRAQPGAERLVAVTHGSDPIMWWRGERGGEVAVPAVEAVDTLGAGDALHGAHAFFRAHPEMSDADRLTRAARIAARRVASVGPRDWLDELRRGSR
ncbi:PfkB family carbohydrate kinase [Nakamurella leprariae]|uniref:Kinase n=1 Tax=Nakamurella leprariae TaxID=2803911 RepID=A0A939BZP0_9ACTN|nr:PfkB family carbohydrate kinase [Nakamurella leprariae]MBM9468370.1 kinase [Nakamurella leprariae]